MKRDFWVIAAVMWLTCVFSVARSQEIPYHDSLAQSLFSMSLDQLLEMEVMSASNTAEKLNRAPATVIVITKEDIAERGYIEMYDILNDLPGFDLSRAHGDDDYIVYPRGYRKTTSDQVLFMIDGMVMNHLYSNNMHLFSQYPLQNIRQIEIVYGPASVVYGANAFSGVIHIITDNENANNVMVTMGENNTIMSEIHCINETKYFKLGINGRFFQSDGPDLSDRTPYISEKIYIDSAIWGPFIKTDFAGYSSPVYSHYIDGFITLDKFTLGAMNWFNESGYGTVHPADKALNNVMWQFMEQSVYLRHETNIGQITSKFLMRYRISGHPGNSMFVTRYNGYVDASYWQTCNRSFTYLHDFSYPLSNSLFFNFGIKSERRQLQKAYDLSYGPSIAEDSVCLYPFDEILPLHPSFAEYSHYYVTDLGAYLQGKYTINGLIDLIGGMRYDYNSIYKSIISPRVGFIAGKNSWNFKSFFGTAFLEPTPRSLYGGWVGSLSNKDLKPERIKTFESSLSYSQKNVSNSVTFFYNLCTDAIGNIGNKPVNVGKRQMIGGEFYSRAMFYHVNPWLRKVKCDLFVSYIKSEEDLTDQDNLGYEMTGNMAPVKVHLMLTGYFGKYMSLSLQNRWLSRTETVKTNPIRHIDPYMINDLFLEFHAGEKQHFSVGLKVYNIFNIEYYHPGYREASAGENAFDINGNFISSPDWYNSRLPQTFRTVSIILKAGL